MFKAKRRAIVPVAAAVIGLVVALLFVTGWVGGSGKASDVSYVDGSTSAVLYTAGHRPLAPDFTGTTLTGSQLRFAAYRGKVVVLNFWGSWCPPCREEAPTLAVLSEKYQRPAQFLGVDENDNVASAEAFAHSFGIKYPSVSDPGYVITQDFSTAVAISGTPTTLVVDPSGHVAGAVFGATTYAELNAILTNVTGKAT